MQVDNNKLIQNLLNKISELTLENAILRASIQEDIPKEGNDKPKEGE